MKVYVVAGEVGEYDGYMSWTDSIWTEEVSADERVRQLEELERLLGQQPYYDRKYYDVKPWELDTVEQ